MSTIDFLSFAPDIAEPTRCDASLKAPFPYFGGKRRAAALIWDRLGDVANYVEFFGGSGAVLLARPAEHAPRVETLNDLDGLLVNFWRALRADPEGVAREADWPVSEVDLHSRHRWLVARRATLADELERDPMFYDVRAAAWWVWGACCWIGQGWGSSKSRQLPQLINGGRGVNSSSMRSPSRQVPHMSSIGQGIHRASVRTELHDTFCRLAARLRHVRFPCGEWRRVSTPAVTWRHGLTGIVINPPYKEGKVDYAVGGRVSSDARTWAVENGDDPRMRIALCGYDGEHDMPSSWECVSWKAKGGYGNQRKDGKNKNSRRERIWFSPHCLKPVAGEGRASASQLSIVAA